jgi:hypothetical protein
MNTIKIQTLEFLALFSESERKAILNTLLIPGLLLLLTSNLLISLCWVLLLTVIYLTVQKNKTENAKMFFTFLKYESLIMLFLILASLIFIIG